METIMAIENRRVDSMRVRLSPDMNERFDKLADAYGFPPATLAAFAISRFVQQEENNRAIVQQAAAQALSQSLNFDESVFEKMFAAMMPDILKQLENEKGTKDEPS
jgi:predicted transcriptional regulator